MRSCQGLKLCLTSGLPSSISCFWKESTLSTLKESNAFDRTHHYMTEDSCKTCINNVLTDACWSQHECRARFKMLQELLIPTKCHHSTAWFLFLSFFIHLLYELIIWAHYMRHCSKWLQLLLKKAMSISNRKLFKASPSSLLLAILLLAHELVHSKLQAWSCQHIKLEC